MAEVAHHPQAFYRGLRLVAMDGSSFELPDEPDNEAQFGRPGSPAPGLPVIRRPGAPSWWNASRRRCRGPDGKFTPYSART
jgi:hypothetical protein